MTVLTFLLLGKKTRRGQDGFKESAAGPQWPSADLKTAIGFGGPHLSVIIEHIKDAPHL
jgi:hypothetical protein